MRVVNLTTTYSTLYKSSDFDENWCTAAFWLFINFGNPKLPNFAHLNSKFIPRGVHWGWTGERPYSKAKLAQICFGRTLYAYNQIKLPSTYFCHNSDPKFISRKMLKNLLWSTHCMKMALYLTIFWQTFDKIQPFYVILEVSKSFWNWNCARNIWKICNFVCWNTFLLSVTLCTLLWMTWIQFDMFFQ